MLSGAPRPENAALRSAAGSALERGKQGKHGVRIRGKVGKRRRKKNKRREVCGGGGMTREGKGFIERQMVKDVKDATQSY